VGHTEIDVTVAAYTDLVGVFNEVEVGEEAAKIGHQWRISITDGPAVFAKIVGALKQLLKFQKSWGLDKLDRGRKKRMLTLESRDRKSNESGDCTLLACRRRDTEEEEKAAMIS